MRVELAAAAIDDLVEIGAYIARDNPERAWAFVADIRAHCERLGKFPYRSPRRPDLARDVRVNAYRGYLVLYRMVGGVVRIERVLHAARDLKRIGLDRG